MSKPNIVYVLTDDTSYGDLGCTGNDIVNTPNIDELYGESVHFTNFHVGPTCAPTRSGLMTGHYANSTGVWHTVGGRSLLRKNEWTIANAFKDAGYTTGIFGKWHLGDEAPYRPYERGFDVSIVHGGGPHQKSVLAMVHIHSTYTHTHTHTHKYNIYVLLGNLGSWHSYGCSFTCTNYLNIVADQVHPFMEMVFPDGSGLFQ